jgi:LmbE family N-acetylglucosaminyl deacetylase
LILLLLPHQDDEFGALGIIDRATRDGLDLLAVYVTDGGGSGASVAVRNTESINVLTALGVRRDRIWFLGELQGSPDGHLVHNWRRMLTALLQALPAGPITEIHSPAWEGGHPDHDACALLAVELAKEISAPAFQFPLYNAYRTRLPFRLFNPVTEQGPIISGGTMRRMSIVRRFRSQWRVFAACAPLMVAHRLRGAPQLMQRLTPDIVTRRPHDGPLFYERRRWLTFDDFQSASPSR